MGNVAYVDAVPSMDETSTVPGALVVVAVCVMVVVVVLRCTGRLVRGVDAEFYSLCAMCCVWGGVSGTANLAAGLPPQFDG